MTDPIRIDLAPVQLGQTDGHPESYALAAFQRSQDPEIEGSGFDLMVELGAFCVDDAILVELFGTSRPTESQIILAFGSCIMADVLAEVVKHPELADMPPGYFLF